MQPQSMAAGFKAYLDTLSPEERAKMMRDLNLFCDAAGGGGQIMLPSTAQPGGGLPAPSAPSCPTTPQRNPSIDIPGCPVNCDACAFPSIETDLRLFSWVEIEAQMWDTDTKIDAVLSGEFPLNAGQTITLQQELRRTLTWIPEYVEIVTTWTGGDPQPGLLSYQWAMGPKASGANGQVQFSNPQKGTQYECGDGCKVVKFPTYKGCDTQVVGALSSLRLIVTLDAAANSVLETVNAVVYHKKAKQDCCGECAAGRGCSC